MASTTRLSVYGAIVGIIVGIIIGALLSSQHHNVMHVAINSDVISFVNDYRQLRNISANSDGGNTTCLYSLFADHRCLYNASSNECVDIIDYITNGINSKPQILDEALNVRTIITSSLFDDDYYIMVLDNTFIIVWKLQADNTIPYTIMTHYNDDELDIYQILYMIDDA